MPEDVLDKAIDDASKTTEVVEDKPEETPKPEAKTEAKEKDDDDDDDKVETAQAKNLYRALSNPKTARPIIEALAREIGLVKGEDLTNKEKATAKKKISEVFKEALGEKLGFLAEDLGPAIEKVLEHYDEDNKARFEAYEKEKVAQETNTAVERFYSDVKDAKQFEDRILELMDELPQGKGTKTYDYIKKLYRIAKSEAQEQGTQAKMTTKLKNSENDATARLHSATDRGEEKTSSKGNVSLDDAIASAVES